MNGDRYLTIRAMADYMGQSVRTVRRLLARGVVPTHRTSRHAAVLVKMSDLERYMATIRTEVKQPDLKSLLASIAERVKNERGKK